MNAAELPAYDGSDRTRRAHGTFLARVVDHGGASLLPGPATTAAALERHAVRFGSEQVAETAAELRLSVVVEKPTRRPGRQRRRR